MFATEPIAFAVRDQAPGFDIGRHAEPSGGTAVWMHAPDARQIHQALLDADVPIAAEPVGGPFGFTFALTDPDGYRITLHDRK